MHYNVGQPSRMRVSAQKNYPLDPVVKRLEDRYEGPMVLYSSYKSDARLTRRWNRSRPVFIRFYSHRLYHTSSQSRLTDRRYLLAQQCVSLALHLRLQSTSIRLRAAFSIVKQDFFVTRTQSCKGCLLLKFRTTTSSQCGDIEKRDASIRFMYTHRS